MSDVAALLERVRAATGPDRELDGEIDAVLRAGLPTLPEWSWTNFPVWKHISNGRVCVLHDSGEHGVNWSSQRFTASVDAALALVDRVLPDSGPNMLYSYALDWHASAHTEISHTAELYLAEGDPPDMTSYQGQAPTLPLAILAALLLALKDQPHD